MLFDESDVEFESDRMSPRKVRKMDEFALTGYIVKFLSILSSDSKSTIRITLCKKLHVSPTILKFLSFNLAGPSYNVVY